MIKFVAKLQQKPSISVNTTLQQKPSIIIDTTIGSAITRQHNYLINRDLPDQHPIGAITGLEDNLGELSDRIDDNKTNIENIVDRVTTNEQNIVTLDKNKAERSELATEITNRENADKDLSDKIDTIEDDLTEDIDSLTNVVDDNYNTLNNKIDTETNERTQAISDLNTGLSEEIQRAKTREDEIDDKLDGINVNITKQIDDLEKDVNDKYNELVRDIDDLTDVVEEDFSSLNTKIDTSVSTLNQRITNVADELGQSIEENVVALQNEDTALQNQINAHSQTLTAYDGRITSNANAITKEISDRSSADDNLQDQINTLSSRGRFLSLWDATTGLPESTPTVSPYVYKTGDYFIVDKVGETNYRPTGIEYVIGQASTIVETEELSTDDVYYFDGSTWHLQINHGKTVSFANLAGEPSDNINLKNALDEKQETIDDLDEIRSGAKLGSTALQSFTETDPTVPLYVKSITEQDISNWNNKSEFSGNYNDLTNKPTKLSDFNNDSGFITSDYHDITKQDVLVSGTNIKTLNNESLLGEGNIDITSAQWGNITGDITAQIDLKNTFATKQDKLTAGTNIEIDPNTNTISATTGYAEIIFRKWSDD